MFLLMEVRSLPRALARDRVIHATLGIVAGLILVYSVPLLSPYLMSLIGDSYGFLVLASVAMAACLLRARRVSQIEERRFWVLVAAAMGLWASAELVYLFVPTFIADETFSVASDFLYLCFYLLLILATEESPHMPAGWSRGDPAHGLGYVGTALFAIGLLAYFVGVPMILNQVVYRTTIPSFYLYLTCDAFLAIRFAYLLLASSDRHWRLLYGLFFLSSILFLLSDVVDTLARLALFEYQSGTFWDFIWFTPFLPIIVAARASCSDPSGNQAASPRADGAAGTRLWAFQGKLHSSVFVYAVVFPGIHFSMYGAGLLDDASRSAREKVVLLCLLSLGAVAYAQRTRLERHNRALQAAVQQKNEELARAQKMEAMGRLAGGIAHDFNNLMTVVLGYGDHLCQALREQPALREKAEAITQSAARAATLTARLLAFTRQQVLSPRWIDLNELIAGLAPILRRLIGEHILVTTDLPPSPRPIIADPAQIEQVIMNLAINARDAMPHGGDLRIRTNTVEIPPDKTGAEPIVSPGEYVVLEIEDSGIGMDAGVRAHLFEPFFTTKEQGQGTGLGLSIVYGIVSQSGGHIQVESNPGRGSKFRILLPAADAERMVGVPACAPLTELEEEHGHVLVVEDDPGVRELIQVSLEERGYAVATAENGVQALSLCRARGRPFDLVITDVIMPQMGGIELVHALRESEPRTKVLFVSGYSDSPERLEGLSGDSSYLGKPFTSAELARKVGETLARS